MKLACGCYDRCRCKAYPPVYRKRCNEYTKPCDDCHEEPHCFDDGCDLSVKKRVVASCPPSQVREVLPVVCSSEGNCTLPRVSYLFDVEIKNTGCKPVKLFAIYDSLSNNDQFIACNFKAKLSSQWIPAKYCEGQTISEKLDVDLVGPNLLLDLKFNPLQPTLEPGDCLRIQIYLQALENVDLYCLTVLEQELLVLACSDPEGDNKPCRYTTDLSVPL